MNKADVLVSAVAVLRDHAAILPAFVEELAAVLDARFANYEILLIDNGSTDDTGDVVKTLLGRHRCLRYLRLTRPTDDETAVLAGLDAAIGDYVATLNPDFDPPTEIPAMVEKCRGGDDLVLGVDRHPTRPGFAYRALRAAFNALAGRLVRFDPVTGTSVFRVLSRQAVNALVKVRLRKRHFSIVAADVGLTTAAHSYERISRSGKSPSHNLFRSLRLGLSVLVHNSLVPLRLASAIGLLGSALSMMYSLYVVGVYLFKQDVMPGWTTLSLAVSGLFGLAFLMLALMGEYLGRLLEESSARPLYHLRDEASSAVMITETRRNVFDRSDAA